MKKLYPRFRLFSNICPNFIADEVADIDIAALHKIGVAAIAFDADSTLVHPYAVEIRPETVEFLKSLKTPLYIATNRVAPDGDQLGPIITARAVIHAEGRDRKPSRRYFERLASQTKQPLNKTAMVGDRLLTDILGANRVGATTVYVRAIGTDPLYLRLTGLRLLERIILRVFCKRN